MSFALVFGNCVELWICIDLNFCHSTSKLCQIKCGKCFSEKLSDIFLVHGLQLETNEMQ